MVSSTKRTTKKPAKKPPAKADKPDFAKARKALDRLLEENTEWLKAMAKR